MTVDEDALVNFPSMARNLHLNPTPLHHSIDSSGHPKTLGNLRLMPRMALRLPLKTLDKASKTRTGRCLSVMFTQSIEIERSNFTMTHSHEIE